MNRKHFLLLITLFYTWTIGAQSVIVDANIDSLQMLIGEQTKIRLEVTLDANKYAQLPFFNDTIVKGIEIIEKYKPDTTYLNKRQRMMITQDYLVTSFDPALYYIPPFEVLVDSIPYPSKALALKIHSIPVPLDPEQPDMFFGQKPNMQPPFAWEDWELAIWLSILAIPLIILVVYLIIRYNDSKTIIKRIKIAPKLPPHIVAMKEMERIKSERIWQNGSAKEYYTELTDVIRNYITERFNFNALEMTSAEIIDELQEMQDKESMKELCELFQTADLVKFAKHNPLMNENDMNLINAIEFIDHTKVDEPIEKKAEPTEVTVEEKRSKRSKIILMACIILLIATITAILAYVGFEIYNSI